MTQAWPTTQIFSYRGGRREGGNAPLQKRIAQNFSSDSVECARNIHGDHAPFFGFAQLFIQEGDDVEALPSWSKAEHLARERPEFFIQNFPHAQVVQFDKRGDQGDRTPSAEVRDVAFLWNETDIELSPALDVSVFAPGEPLHHSIVQKDLGGLREGE